MCVIEDLGIEGVQPSFGVPPELDTPAPRPLRSAAFGHGDASQHPVWTMRRLVVFVWSLSLGGCATATRGPGSPDDANCAWRVCVTSRETPSGRTYRAVNREPVPATVVLTFRSLENLRAPAGMPVHRVVPAESSTVLVRLSTIDEDRSIGAAASISIDLGSSRSEPDDHVYAVPFGGSSGRVLTQGFGGAASHLADNRYGLDFAMPEGTPVLAARAGTVLYLQDGFTEGGSDPDLLERANVVVVAHRDGTMASYGHLAPGIRVSVGDTVREGDILGSSGSTGFADQPHLHFHVGTRLLGSPGRTIAFALGDREGRVLGLEEGSLIEPARQISR